MQPACPVATPEFLSPVASSSTNAGFERRWQAFSERVAEVIDARVYSGIHFRTTDEVSANVGREIAKPVMMRQLRRRQRTRAPSPVRTV